MYNKMKPWGILLLLAATCHLSYLPGCKTGRQAPSATISKSDTGGSSRDTVFKTMSRSLSPATQLNDTGGSSRDTLALKAPPPPGRKTVQSTNKRYRKSKQ